MSSSNKGYLYSAVRSFAKDWSGNTCCLYAPEEHPVRKILTSSSLVKTCLDKITNSTSEVVTLGCYVGCRVFIGLRQQNLVGILCKMSIFKDENGNIILISLSPHSSQDFSISFNFELTWDRVDGWVSV
jgi:hypothetical protein